MNISLTPQLEELIKRKVATGRYGSASEVVREALRLLEDRDRTNEEKLNALRSEIRKGLESGPPIDGDEVFEGLDALMAQYPNGKPKSA